MQDLVQSIQDRLQLVRIIDVRCAYAIVKKVLNYYTMYYQA